MASLSRKLFANPFYRVGSLQIMMFYAGWGIWWSFFQIWLTTEQKFTGSQVVIIYSCDSAVAMILMFAYGIIQDRLGLKRNLLYFLVGLEILLGPFFTWVYVPMLNANFYFGAVVGAIYLGAAYLAASPLYEAFVERYGRRYNYAYGQARAWGSFGYAISALCAGFLFTISPYLLYWCGTCVAALLMIVLLKCKPENNAELSKRYAITFSSTTGAVPSFKDMAHVFGMGDVWKIIIFVVMSWTFYTVFDQQMFPEFFTRFFDTPAQGQQAYGVLNSIEVFLEFFMMGIMPIVMYKIGIRRSVLLGMCIMVVRIGGCGLVTNPVGVGAIKLLHAPETAIYALAVFRYLTLHFDTRLSATIYMVAFQIAAQLGQIVFSTPLGTLRDSIGYQSTFLVISGIAFCAGTYAFFMLKKDDQDVNGQPLSENG